jgi:hypothetical protein
MRRAPAAPLTELSARPLLGGIGAGELIPGKLAFTCFAGGVAPVAVPRQARWMG